MPVNLGSAEGYIDLDFSSLLKGVDSSLSAIKKLDSAYTESESKLRKMEAELKNSGGVFQAAAQKSERLTLELDTAREKADAYRKIIDSMGKAVKNAAQEHTELEPKISRAKKQLEQTEIKVRELASAYKSAAEETKKAAEAHGEQSEEAKKAAEAEAEVKSQLDKATNSANEYRNALLQMESRHEKLRQDMNNAAQKTSEFRTELNNTEAQIADLSRELAETESTLLNLGTSMQNAGNKFQAGSEKIGRIGSALTLGVTAPIIGIGTAAVKSGNDFEAQMSRVSAIADAYGSELEELRDLAIELGAETSFSATSAAEAMENLASAGFKTQEIMDAMPGMLDLAASSGEDLATSADIAASTLRGFGLEASEAGHVADVLAKNAADTNAAISDTGLAMKYIAPVARSAGWSLEEVTAAIGKMADAGIKGEQAGTTLRGALTRLMKPTDNMYKAMEDLGVAFYDAEGKMKPLSTIVDELQTATEGLTDEQRDNRIATIFGTEALSGMKVLLSSSKEELDRLTSGLENADGAAQKMADTMLDNTKGSIEEMNGSLETAAITIQKQLAPWITKGAKKVTELANQFADLDEETQGTILGIAGIAAASGPAVKGLSKVTGGIGKLVKGTGGLIKDLGKISSAKKAAEAIGSMGSFSANSVEGVSGLSKALFKLASPTGAVIAATTAIAGLGIGVYAAMQRAREAAKEADLEKRFGDITLSMEEVEDIAEQLTTNDWTMQVDAVIEARGKLDELKEDVQSSLDEVNKLGWKINVGLGLSAEENESFRDSMDSYINDSIAYIQQKQYTASLAVDAIMTPGSQSYENVRNFVNEFYSGSQAQMQELGEAMAAEVDKALADGVITEDEYLNIQSIQAKLQDLISRTEDAQYTAKIKSMQLQVDGGKLTADSFQNIMTTAGEQLESQMAAADQTFLKFIEEVQIAFESGEIPQSEYEEILRDAQEDLNRKKGELILENVTVGIDTLQGNYGDKLEEWRDEFADTVAYTIGDGFTIAGDAINYSQLYASIGENFDAISDAATDGARDLLNSMQPNAEELKKVAQSYINVGKIPPENIQKGLEDHYELQMMAGNLDYMFQYLVTQIAHSPDLQEAMVVARENGQEIPQELAEGLRDMYGLELIEKNGEFMWETVREQAQTSAEVMQEQFRQYGIELPEALATGLDSKSASLVDATMKLLEKLNEGKVLKEEELVSVFATFGMDLPEALISSLSSQNANVQRQAIEMYSQIQYADEAKRPEILAQMLDLGQNVDESLCLGISGNLALVENESSGMISVIDKVTGQRIRDITPAFASRLKEMGVEGFDSMDEVMKSSSLTAPTVKELDTKPVENWVTRAQRFLLNNPLFAEMNVSSGSSSSRISKHANGGIVQKQTLSWLAEGDQPEAVIPLSAEKRSRGVELWKQAGEELGMMDTARGAISDGTLGRSPVFDVQRLASAVAAELRKAPIEVHPEFYVSSGDVYLEGEAVGRSMAPVIDTQLSRIQERRQRGG